MSTGRYAVIGDPIEHSWSPLIHNTLFRAMGVRRYYEAVHVTATELEDAMPWLTRDYDGFNVTIPHKEAVMAHLDAVHPKAEALGAVNTVKNTGGLLQGYNTDGYGFRMGLGHAADQLQGQEVLVLGAGGSARVVAREIIECGGRVTLANRNIDRARRLTAELTADVKIRGIDDVTGRRYFALVNTTPVGMSPHTDAMPLTREQLQGVAVVYDLIYNPWRTRLLAEAQDLGAQIINGWPMLFYQAMGSQEIWLGRSLDGSLVQRVYEEVTNEVAKPE